MIVSLLIADQQSRRLSRLLALAGSAVVLDALGAPWISLIRISKTSCLRLRRIRLPSIAAEHLLVYHLELETASGRKLKSTDWIFPNTPGSDRPWEQQAACKAVREAFIEAGLGDVPGAGLHCLRRTWATLGLESGHSLATVQREGRVELAQGAPRELCETHRGAARPARGGRRRRARSRRWTPLAIR